MMLQRRDAGVAAAPPPACGIAIASALTVVVVSVVALAKKYLAVLKSALVVAETKAITSATKARLWCSRSCRGRETSVYYDRSEVRNSASRSHLPCPAAKPRADGIQRDAESVG